MALIAVIAVSLFAVTPASALDLNPADYFKIAFVPTSLDKSAVTAGETFHAVIKGYAECIQDLPLNISEITIKSEVVARPNSGGTELTLNPEYVIAINPLPNNAGETFEINQAVALEFPAGAATGDYTIIGRLIEAKVKVTLLWLDVTGSFPAEEIMGTVRCVSTSAATTTTAPSMATAPPVITLPPATQPAPPLGSIQAQPKSNDNTFLMTLLIAIGLALIVFTIVAIALLRRRRD